jgi:hypothetical protein
LNKFSKNKNSDSSSDTNRALDAVTCIILILFLIWKPPGFSGRRWKRWKFNYLYDASILIITTLKIENEKH